MDQDIMEKCREYAKDISLLINVSLSILDVFREEIIDATNSHFCNKCTEKRCGRYQFHLQESCKHKSGRSSVYCCTRGFVFIAIVIRNDNHEKNRDDLGAIVAGPVILSDTAACSSDPRVPHFDSDRLKGFISVLQHGMSAINGDSTDAIYRNDIGPAGPAFAVKSPLTPSYTESVYVHDNAPELIKLQKKLIFYLRNENPSSREKYLCEIIGTLFPPISVRGLVAAKLQAIELIILLSQAAISSGITFEQVLGKYDDYLAVIAKIIDEPELERYLTELFAYFLDAAKDAYSKMYSPRIIKMLEFMDKNYAKKITLRDIAEYACLSDSYAGRQFMKETGKSFRAYLNEIRVEKSKELLKNPTIPLLEVAQCVGFEEQSYYTHIFKKLTGMTPNEYRMPPEKDES